MKYIVTNEDTGERARCADRHAVIATLRAQGWTVYAAVAMLDQADGIANFYYDPNPVAVDDDDEGEGMPEDDAFADDNLITRRRAHGFT